MARFSKLANDIIDTIAPNGNGQITGQTLQDTLLDIVDTVEVELDNAEATAQETSEKVATIESNLQTALDKANSALQSIPSEYVTESELSAKGFATTSQLNNKVDKVTGKGLSTEDFTTALKSKLEGLRNYDDTALSNAVSTLRRDFDKLVSGDTTIAIKTFNEVIAFLDGISDSEDLDSIIAGIEQQIASKQDTIPDLSQIRAGAAKGATALQEHQDLSSYAKISDVSTMISEAVMSVINTAV